MSDTENKTENTAETKTDDTPETTQNNESQADSKTSTRSNVVIPLVLLLVSAIVIVATFYKDEYNELVAQDDSVTETTADILDTDKSAEAEIPEVVADTPVAVTPEAASVTATTAEAKAPDTTVTEEQVIPAADATPVSNDIEAPTKTDEVIADSSKNVETVAAASTEQNQATQVNETAQADDRITAMRARAEQNRPRMQSMHSPYQRSPYPNRQAYEQARQEAIARAQEQAKKRDEMIRQQRQAYEKEMQARRQRDEAKWQAAMKAQQERRTKIAETQKAVYQLVEKNRMENKHKLEEMHKRISEMHDEIHQMMQESRPHKSSAQVQVESPSIEQM